MATKKIKTPWDDEQKYYWSASTADRIEGYRQGVQDTEVRYAELVAAVVAAVEALTEFCDGDGLSSMEKAKERIMPERSYPPIPGSDEWAVLHDEVPKPLSEEARKALTADRPEWGDEGP